MMDYQGFWLGFVLLFGVLPVVFGAGGDLVWAWRAGGAAPACFSQSYSAGSTRGSLFLLPPFCSFVRDCWAPFTSALILHEIARDDPRVRQRIEIGRYQRDMRSKKRLMTLPRGGRAS